MIPTMKTTFRFGLDRRTTLQDTKTVHINIDTLIVYNYIKMATDDTLVSISNRNVTTMQTTLSNKKNIVGTNECIMTLYIFHLIH